MKTKKTTSCPRCETSFQVEEEQLRQAGGRVRCGNCLQVFNGATGEAEFVAPALREGGDSLLTLSVRPMENAELPAPVARASAGAIILVLLLGLGLVAQLTLSYLERQAGAALEISRLVVRPHPDTARALRMDAILRNRSGDSQPYPALVLSFSTLRGEPRARRTFTPEEYLHGNYPPAIPPSSEIQVSLAVRDPGSDAINYRLRLLPATPPAN